MAPLKTPNYATIFKKFRKDLINSTPPPFNKKQKETRQIFFPTKS
jgi:hypothetical protein